MVTELAKSNHTSICPVTSRASRLQENVRSRLRLRDIHNPYYRLTHQEAQEPNHFVTGILVPVMMVDYSKSTLDNIVLKRIMYVLIKGEGG